MVAGWAEDKGAGTTRGDVVVFWLDGKSRARDKIRLARDKIFKIRLDLIGLDAGKPFTTVKQVAAATAFAALCPAEYFFVPSPSSVHPLNPSLLLPAAVGHLCHLGSADSSFCTHSAAPSTPPASTASYRH